MSNFKPSEEQVAINTAFATGRRHIAIIARAGTGKTTTLEHALPLAPERMKAYLTFARRNVEEAQKKIKDPAINPNIMSLNGLGHRYILKNWMGSRPDDGVENDRINAVIDGNPEFIHFSGSKYRPVAAIRKLIGLAKNTIPRVPTSADLVGICNGFGIAVEGYCAQMGWGETEMVRCAELAIQAAMTRDKLSRISFNDQVWLPLVMGWAVPRFDLVAVDEAQDMNACQLRMAELACRGGGRIALIGDPQQAIYGFRGADTGGMERMIEQLDAEILTLTSSYRCPKAVVALAKKLVPDFRAIETAPEGAVEALRSLGIAEEMMAPGDAVISRVNAPLAGICLRLLQRGVPAYVEGRDFGKTLLDLIKSLKATSISDLMERLDLWEEKKYKNIKGDEEAAERQSVVIRDTAETIRVMSEVVKTVQELENKIYSLFHDAEGGDRLKVVCSSTHRAKGLEFPRVFLLRQTYRHRDTVTTSEEGNLLYVGITRAKAILYTVFDGSLEPRGRYHSAGRDIEPS